jgi:adenosine deaminase
LFTIVPTNSYYNRELRGLVDDYKPESESNWTDVDSDDDESAEVVAGVKDFALHHPISNMAKADLKIMPNSDDPPLHHTDPANAYAEMVTTFNLPLDRLREFVINGIDGAWVDEKTRSNWRKEWLTVYDELVPNLNYSV